MVPIGDANPTRRFPVMNLTLIGLNVLVFLFELQLSGPALDRFIFAWGVIPSDVLAAIAHPLAARSVHAFETLITSQFIHAGWAHIIGNMLFLFVFWDNIEDVLGSFPYLIFYLVAGIAASLAQTYVLAPFLGNVDLPSIGASGAIAGVLGAYIVLYPTAPVRVLIPVFIFLTFSVPAIIMIGIWFLEQFVAGIGSLTPQAAQTGGVAFWAHVGGFITGMILILPFWGTAHRGRDTRAVRYQVPYDDSERW
jgi:membrane associated rhomboid family serine protease